MEWVRRGVSGKNSNEINESRDAQWQTTYGAEAWAALEK
jgi:hypothetical protein